MVMCSHFTQNKKKTEENTMTDERRAKIERVLNHRQHDLTLVLANIHDPHNVSAIYRSADAFGVNQVHLYYTDTAFPTLAKKTSASARKWVDTVRHNSKESLLETLKDYNLLATACTPISKTMYAYDLAKPTAIIMGNEHSGVPEELLQHVNGEIYIPMFGMIQSFNVSVAAALLLGEASRQRQAAGFYENSRMPKEMYEAKLEDWLER